MCASDANIRAVKMLAMECAQQAVECWIVPRKASLLCILCRSAVWRARQDSNLFVWPNLHEFGFELGGVHSVLGGSVAGSVTDVMAPRADAVADLWGLVATLDEMADERKAGAS